MSHTFLACAIVAALLSTGCRPPPADAPPVATSSPDGEKTASTAPAKTSRKSRRAWD